MGDQRLLIAPDGMAARQSQFIFTRAPFASCHAATIAEVAGEQIAAWFGGTKEGAADVRIWLARYQNDRRWSEPVLMPPGARGPCWNPVLHAAQDGRLLLFWR